MLSSGEGVGFPPQLVSDISLDALGVRLQLLD